MSIRNALGSDQGFGIFWLGYSLSVLGDAVTRTTLIWYVFHLTESSVALGWLSFCLTAPIIVGGLMAGWLLDRFDRRKIIVIDSLVKTLVVMSLPVLASFDALPLWYVYATASVFGFLMMIPLAGVPSLLSLLLSKDQLNAGNALETIGYTMGGVVGPPLAGLVIAQIGALDALYLDAATYLIFAWAVWQCRPKSEVNEGNHETPGSLGAAVRIIFRNPVLASTTIMYLIFNIGLGALLVVVPLFAESVLNGGPELYGILLGCIAVGELAGSLATGFVRLPIAEGLAICLTLVMSGIEIAVAALSPGALGVGTGFLLYGIFSAPLTIWGQTLRMKIIPAGYHGRCFAIMRTLMQGGGPVGGLSAGFAAPVFGIRAVIAGVALITCLIGLTGLQIFDLRRAR